MHLITGHRDSQLNLPYALGGSSKVACWSLQNGSAFPALMFLFNDTKINTFKKQRSKSLEHFQKLWTTTLLSSLTWLGVLCLFLPPSLFAASSHSLQFPNVNGWCINLFSRIQHVSAPQVCGTLIDFGTWSIWWSSPWVIRCITPTVLCPIFLHQGASPWALTVCRLFLALIPCRAKQTLRTTRV